MGGGHERRPAGGPDRAGGIADLPRSRQPARRHRQRSGTVADDGRRRQPRDGARHRQRRDGGGTGQAVPPGVRRGHARAVGLGRGGARPCRRYRQGPHRGGLGHSRGRGPGDRQARPVAAVLRRDADALWRRGADRRDTGAGGSGRHRRPAARGRGPAGAVGRTRRRPCRPPPRSISRSRASPRPIWDGASPSRGATAHSPSPPSPAPRPGRGPCT